jgi:membrane protein
LPSDATLRTTSVMARLSELIPAIRLLGPFRFVKNIWREIGDDNLFTQAAALAYSWLFAIFPFFIVLLTLVPYLPRMQKDMVLKQVDSSLDILSKKGAEPIRNSLDQVLNEPRNGLLSIGLVICIWAASGGVSMTMSALDDAFDAPHVRPFYQQRPIAIVLTLVLSIMVLLVFVLLPIGTAITRYLAHIQYFPSPILWALNFSRYALAILLMFGVLATLYRFGTIVKQQFVFFSPGAIFTVIVWILLAETFRIYIDKFGRYERMYGAVSGVTIVLFFFYLDALMLLIGAEINSEIDGAMKRKGMETEARREFE